MTELEPLSPELIRRYLDADGSGYEVDEDGDIVVEYDPDPDSGANLTVYLSITEREWYVILIVDERTFPQSDRERLTALCNSWNTDNMYPMASVVTSSDDPDRLDILLEYTSVARFGISQEQLKYTTDEVVWAGSDFWDWAHTEHGL